MYEFAGRYNDKDLFIKEFSYWVLLVRPVPVTIGSCVILLKRKCPSLAELNKEEITEFIEVCNYFENSCKAMYGAVKFNYHANMMKEDFVHFHAIPRYDKVVNRHGLDWVDHDWPLAEKMTKMKVEKDILIKVKEDFLENERNNNEK